MSWLRGVQFWAYYTAWDTANNVGKTGDKANHTIKVSKDGSTPGTTATNNGDVTNHKEIANGEYGILLTASEATCDQLNLFGSSSASNIVIIPRQYPMVRLPNADPGGNLGLPTVDASNRVAAVAGAVGSVTGAVGSVTGAVGSVTGDVGGKVLGGGGGAISGTGARVDVRELVGVTGNATKLGQAIQTAQVGTAQAASTTTTLKTLFTGIDDHALEGLVVKFIGDVTSQLAGVGSVITVSNGTTGDLTVALPRAPAVGDTFVIQ